MSSLIRGFSGFLLLELYFYAVVHIVNPLYDRECQIGILFLFEGQRKFTFKNFGVPSKKMSGISLKCYSVAAEEG
ncbi:hypothetical protein [Planococcus lenghuensis]|uniref:Uncharacterized protein n=1 Tax=Planococcus lenghuensis TaxID=2213202 RepID=A0A1Q2L0P7_9BACL|nr:hypothetical protein [Planococcus lenghuensis]AQQ54009.1 hypothetical protein B0X71_13495 [Planococcus lenghuensis]